MNNTHKLARCLLSMFFLLIAACNGKSPTPPKNDIAISGNNPFYEIDPSIKKELETSKKDTMFSGVMKLDLKTNGEDKNGLKDYPFPCEASYTMKSDTFQIMLTPEKMSGLMIGIRLIKDSAKVFQVAYSGKSQTIYKFNLSDSSYESGILIEALSSRVVLTAAPKKGEPIEGIFSFEGNTYYRKHEPVDDKIVLNAKGRFIAQYEKN